VSKKRAGRAELCHVGKIREKGERTVSKNNLWGQEPSSSHLTEGSDSRG